MKNALAVLLALLCCHAGSQEVYKWTDKDGKVHFGDKKSAPMEAKKAEVKVQQPSGAAPPRVEPTPARPAFESPTAAPPTGAPKGNARCQQLADAIMKAGPGGAPAGLSKEFDLACPGIAYRCETYKRQPENNRCAWVTRPADGSIIKHFEYD